MKDAWGDEAVADSDELPGDFECAESTGRPVAEHHATPAIRDLYSPEPRDFH